MTTTKKARRRGFRGAEWNSLTEYQRYAADRYAREADKDGAYMVEIRKASYCGPDSAGDRNAAVFIASFTNSGPSIFYIEAGNDSPLGA